ncbi:hypothetical protein D3C76_1343450 [compost metagenome]
MADVRHQRDRRQFFHPHARLIGVDHRQTQARSLAGLFAAGSNQQPVGGIACGDEILATTQAQIVQARLHVSHPQAALLGRAQRAKAQRCTWPKHAQRCLIAHQERQPRRRHHPCADHGQFKRGDVAQLLQQRGEPLAQIRVGGQASVAVQQGLPGHKRLLKGCHTSITKA